MDAMPENPEQVLRLPANGGLDPQLSLAVLAAHAVPGLDEQTGGEHRRPVRIGDRNVVIGLRFTEDAVLLRRVDAALTAEDRPPLSALLRRWFALDLDLEPINARLLRDPTLAPWSPSGPGSAPSAPRIPSRPRPRPCSASRFPWPRDALSPGGW